ncbi:VRR-NUC domain-containing protein [Chromobacterium haemolyticum]|uniref:VRR-NUC domain-containing protein n=1 Tax=Chromobacterium haemolyticum TaxID=394935 RepID=UPI0009D9B60F|nr:VRR-NUC domain-containing protein [Chromobacterium haemolyticum]OQS35925.1 hypothetical protein B0T39_17275 [Chromobacterium haemolyticum]
MTTLNPKTAGNGLTRLEEDQQYAKLPSVENKPYLQPKAEVAVRVPDVRIGVSKLGKTFTINARQAVMSAEIRGDEENHKYLWYYKAEVSFDMPSSRRGVPKPFLSTTEGSNPNRRHSLTPFPKGLRKNYLRRPDLIIVKNKAVRWPGRATKDHDGVPHGDNLHRVVEIKFPGDALAEKQENAYKQIAGGVDRFTLLHVIPPGEKRRQTEPVKKPAPVFAPRADGIPRGENRRVPIYGPKPLPDPAFYEEWLDDAKQLVHSLAEDGKALAQNLRQAVDQLSAKVQAELKQHAPWLFTAGHWLQDKANDTWHFVNEQGKRIASWTSAQLRAAWAEIQRVTDLTLETLRQIDWTQVLLDIGKGLLAVAVVIAGVVVVFVLGGWLVAALAALVEMGAAAWAAVAVMLGGGAMAAAS